MSERTKDTCSACGTAPTNHALALFLSVADEYTGKFDKFFSRIVEKKFWQKMLVFLENLMIRFAHLIGIASFRSDTIDKVLNSRSGIIWEEAKRRGIPMEQEWIFGRPTDYFRAKIKGEYHYFNSLPIPPWLPQDGYKWVDNKMRLADELQRVGIPAPKTVSVRSLSEAEKAFEMLAKPLIIKPRFGSRGRHTTTNINTLDELRKAYNLARQITVCCVVQEHLSGSVYRATVIDGKLVGFYRADQPTVTGDGVKTIMELIEEKNQNRRPRVSEVIINEDLRNFIGRNGYRLDSVLPVGVTQALSAKTGRMYGSYTKEMFPEVHPKMHGIFEKAGEVCDAPVLGFDLIIGDATTDPDTQRWGIIECNSLPFIDLHYMALEGEPLDLSKNVWDLWKK